MGAKHQPEPVPAEPRQPLRGWLKTLAVGAAAAGVYAANVETVPLTGCKQLLLKWPGTASASDSSESLPASARLLKFRLPSKCQQLEQLEMQGLQIMQLLYQRSAAGANLLAQHSPDLRERLTGLTSKVELQHQTWNVKQQGAFFTNYRECAWHKLWGGPHKKRFVVNMSAGFLLSGSSLSSFIWAMSHEMSHGIAKHTNEKESWRRLITVSIFARLAVSSMLSWGCVPYLIISFLLSRIANSVLVDAFLSRHLELEADVLGAALSTAAGCCSDDVISMMASMQAPDAEDIEFQQVMTQVQQLLVQRLQMSMPGSQLPRQVKDTGDVLHLLQAWAKQQSAVSDAVRQEQLWRILACWQIVAWQYAIDRHLTTRPLASHPYWLDRVSSVIRNPLWTGKVWRGVVPFIKSQHACATHLLQTSMGQEQLTAYHATWATLTAAQSAQIAQIVDTSTPEQNPVGLDEKLELYQAMRGVSGRISCSKLEGSTHSFLTLSLSVPHGVMQ